MVARTGKSDNFVALATCSSFSGRLRTPVRYVTSPSARITVRAGRAGSGRTVQCHVWSEVRLVEAHPAPKCWRLCRFRLRKLGFRKNRF